MAAAKCANCQGTGMTAERTEAPWQPNQFQYFTCEWCDGSGVEYVDAATERPAGEPEMTDDEWAAALAAYAANEPARRARWAKMLVEVRR